MNITTMAGDTGKKNVYIKNNNNTSMSKEKEKNYENFKFNLIRNEEKFTK